MPAEPRYLLDSNIAIYLVRGSAPVASERLAQCDLGSVVTSAICLAEMRVGRTARQLAALEIMLRGIEVIQFDAAAAHAYGHLPFKRGSFDRLIGAHALSLDLTLVTANESDFIDIPGLRVENWTQS